MPLLADYYARISADDSGFVSALSRSEQRFSGFVGVTTGMMGSIAAKLVVFHVLQRAIEQVGQAMFSPIMKAADLGESMNKVEVVFGSSAGKVVANAEEMSRKFGIVRATSLDAAGGIGLIAKASGMGQDAAADLSIRVVKLAGDISSLYNVPLDQALMAIRSGLVGEAEPMRRFGVLLDENSVKAEALRMGLGGGSKELTQQEKVLARVNLIFAQTTDAQGDLERTADSAKNSVRRLSGQWEELQTSMGEALMPGLEAIMPAVGELLTGMGEFLASHKGEIAEMARTFGEDLVNGIKAAIAYLQLLGAELVAIKGSMGAAGKGFLDAIRPPPEARQGFEGFVKAVMGPEAGQGFIDAVFGKAAPAGALPGGGFGPSDSHPELRGARGQQIAGTFAGTEQTAHERYVASVEWLRQQMADREAAALEGREAVGQGVADTLTYGLASIYRVGGAVNALTRRTRDEGFKSQTVELSSVATDVAKAALSRDPDEKERAKQQAKDIAAIAENTAPLKDFGKGVLGGLIPRFQP